MGRLGTRAKFTGDFFEPVTKVVNPDKTVAEISIPIAGNGTDDRSVNALHKLRDDVIPFAFGPVPDASAYVTGMVDWFAEFETVRDRLPEGADQAFWNTVRGNLDLLREAVVATFPE